MRVRSVMLVQLLILVPAVVGAQQIIWERRDTTTEGMTYFDQEHHEEYVLEALAELTGKRPAADASRGDLALITLELLDGLPEYGQKEVAMVPPPIPHWFMEGYLALNPTSVSQSRYLDAAAAAELVPDAEIGALYAFWCAYDAEWFSLSRHADHKAWLSAVLLHYPPQWMALRGETESSLHRRLVTPLQTPDEPYREIDNWINNFTKHEEAFAKPKVRDALVQELSARGGLESDARFFEDPAYSGPTPMGLDVSERHFYLLAALSVEFFQEIHELEPGTKQLGHFRDYFANTFRYHSR
jgi:hypothetical protein